MAVLFATIVESSEQCTDQCGLKVATECQINDLRNEIRSLGNFCSVPSNTWTTVFKFPTTSTENVYNLWHNIYDFTLSNLWSKVKLWKFTMKNADVSHYIGFDTVGSDRDNWFTASRVVNSTYTDLTSDGPFNIFSVDGYLDRPKGFDRRFYVNRNYAQCPGDYGYFVVIDTNVNLDAFVCDWDKTDLIGDPYPQLLFCPGPTGCLWESNLIHADELSFEIFM